jgi:equilibrative nucleoside transporter 1/2/3
MFCFSCANITHVHSSHVKVIQCINYPHYLFTSIYSGQSIAGLAPALVQYINALHTSPSTDPSPDTDNFDSVQRSVFLVFPLASLVSFISILGYLKMSTKTTHTSYTTLTHEDEEAQTLVHSTEQTTSLKHLLHLLNVMRLPVLVVFLTFLITLAIFPAITVSVTSQDPTIRRDVFIAIHFIIFSSFEWIGRILPGFVTIRWLEDHRHLLLATLGRALLLPLLLLTNIQSNQRWYDPIILNDYLFMLLIALLGLSNGWFSTLGMMYGPTCVTTPKDRAQAGTLMVLVLVVGLAMGAWASFFVRAIVCGCNPFITPV